MRFEEDIVNITEQLDAARREKSEAQRHQTASGASEENLKQELASLQKVYDGLNSKRESEIKAFEQEQQRWKATLEQLRHENDAVVQEVRHRTTVHFTRIVYDSVDTNKRYGSVNLLRSRPRSNCLPSP